MNRDNEVLPPRYALFDLDFCLLVGEPEVQKGAGSREHLTEVQIEGLPFKHYAINLEIMAQIFKALQAQEIIVGFVTAGLYNAEVIRKFFEKIYDMPKDSLINAPFIGGRDFGGQFIMKGVKIRIAYKLRLFPNNAQITLIDDDVSHVHSARELGYCAIITHGYPNQSNDPDVEMLVNHYYLQEIIDKFGLDIDLPESLISTERSQYTPLLQSRKAAQSKEQPQNDCLEIVKCLIRCIPCCTCI